MKSKPRLKSKTLWTNGVLIALAVAILNLPEMAAWIETLPDTYHVITLILVGAVNIVLREVTDQPLSGWTKPLQIVSDTSQKPQAKPKAKK